MVAKQDFERFLNERAHGVVCSVCGRQDWVMNVNGDTENILIMCSHCGHVVSFDRDYVEATLDKPKGFASDSTYDSNRDSDKPINRALTNLSVNSSAEFCELLVSSFFGVSNRFVKTILNLIAMVKAKFYPI